ncbi:hypothetical protein ACTWPF_03420 [Oceanobacillus sp. M65]
MNSWPMFTTSMAIFSTSMAMFITSYYDAGHLTDDDHKPAG